ncbi:MAG: hypothetical protein LBL76_07360 [Treponema sp.]|nr:hypothetical protein [Treponema sp.]
MQITEVLKTGSAYSRVRFDDGTEAQVPTPYALAGKDYISVKLLKKDRRYTQYEGIHLSARLEGRHGLIIRNKDTICRAMIAQTQWAWKAAQVWCLFMMDVTPGDTFETAVDYFERKGIKMRVSG